MGRTAVHSKLEFESESCLASLKLIFLTTKYLKKVNVIMSTSQRELICLTKQFSSFFKALQKKQGNLEKASLEDKYILP